VARGAAGTPVHRNRRLTTSPGELSRCSSGSQAQVHGARTQLFLDAKQLVVLGDAVGAEQEPVLICPTPVATARSAMKCPHFRPSGAHHGGISVATAQLDRFKSLRDRADWLTLIKIELATPSSMPRCSRLCWSRTGSPPVDLAAQLVGHQPPALPVVLARPSSMETIGTGAPSCPVAHHLSAVSSRCRSS